MLYDRELLTLAREAAVLAAKGAGAIIKERFLHAHTVTWKGEEGDLVTEVDGLSEAYILDRLQTVFPDHAIRSEETGWNGIENDWLWLVDPLDGTNNYAIGLPVFGVSLTLIRNNEPMLGVIYEPILDRLYIAEKGRGADLNGERMKPVVDGKPARKMTVGWIQGHHVQKKQEATSLKHNLDNSFKRVLRLWAPTMQWSALARGELDGIVLYDSEGDDLYSGILLAREAGAVIEDYEGRPFEGMNPEPYIIAAHPSNIGTVRDAVRRAIQTG
ncbi:inositol monophosphatase [Paenibacillus tarimensis]